MGTREKVGVAPHAPVNSMECVAHPLLITCPLSFEYSAQQKLSLGGDCSICFQIWAIFRKSS